jgi:hypothetical protein
MKKLRDAIFIDNLKESKLSGFGCVLTFRLLSEYLAKEFLSVLGRMSVTFSWHNGSYRRINM